MAEAEASRFNFVKCRKKCKAWGGQVRQTNDLKNDESDRALKKNTNKIEFAWKYSNNQTNKENTHKISLTF